jgi:hypothetical protein
MIDTYNCLIVLEYFYAFFVLIYAFETTVKIAGLGFDKVIIYPCKIALHSIVETEQLELFRYGFAHWFNTSRQPSFIHH